jgi:hypothetical protein
MSNTTRKLSSTEKAKPQSASSSLQGWPGYRTRDGRSGLDPIDSPAEEGHMLGVFVHNLLAGRLRTKNPIYLFLLAILGILLLAPLLFAILEAFRGNLLPLGGWAFIIFAGLLGIAFLINLIKNLF